ncbi:sensor histidine kinase [Chloroflexus sp.]|uniref:sensor histidine kinase n=1 Tax=Chloroflexus sp. TaxID=1904827 RepID=UPI002ADD4102|nr:sensor histidine kinase [Chloroflexus sp.]
MMSSAQQAGWWQRLTAYFNNGQHTLMMAAYAVITVALVEYILFHRHLPAERFYPVIVLLSLLLALNAAWDSLQLRWGDVVANRLFFGLSSLIFLVVNYLGLDEGWTFLPFILFVVGSQAIIGLGIWPGLALSLLLYAGWNGVLWLRGVSPTQILTQAPSIALGLIFTLIFSIVLARLSEQMARAERLAAELRAANEALAASRERELALAAAEERVRLAHEIHDGLGHHLTALHVQLQAAARLLEHDPVRAAQALHLCREAAQAALAEVRQSVALMCSNPLADQPLPVVIERLVHHFSRVASFQIRFEQAGEIGEISPAMVMTLFRAAQEGLTNVQKHAQATCVTVRLLADVESVRLDVINDGPPAPAIGETGFGLAGLRERVSRLGGEIQAAPQPEGGFLLAIVLPRRSRNA